MAKDYFDIEYKVGNGYSDRHLRTHRIQVGRSEVVNKTVTELEDMYNSYIEHQFVDQIYPFGVNFTQFYEWATAIQAEGEQPI